MCAFGVGLNLLKIGIMWLAILLRVTQSTPNFYLISVTSVSTLSGTQHPVHCFQYFLPYSVYLTCRHYAQAHTLAPCASPHVSPCARPRERFCAKIKKLLKRNSQGQGSNSPRTANELLPNPITCYDEHPHTPNFGQQHVA